MYVCMPLAPPQRDVRKIDSYIRWGVEKETQQEAAVERKREREEVWSIEREDPILLQSRPPSLLFGLPAGHCMS